MCGATVTHSIIPAVTSLQILPLLLRQINFATLDGLQCLASLTLCLLALSPVAIIGAIPMQLLTFPATVAECLAASAILARITLKSGATTTARIADLAELGSDLISAFLEARPSCWFKSPIGHLLETTETAARLTGNRKPQFAKSKVLHDKVTVTCAKS